MPLTCGRRRSDVTIALLRSRAPAAPPAMPPPCDDRRRDEAEHLPRPARCADHPCAARSRAGCCSGRLPDRRGRAPHPAGHAHDGSEHGRAAQRHGTHGGLLVRPGVMARAGHAAVLRGGRVRLGDLVVAPVGGGRPRAGLGARPAAAPGRAGERCVGRPGAGRRPRDARGDARRLGLDGAAGARDAPVVRGAPTPRAWSVCRCCTGCTIAGPSSPWLRWWGSALRSRCCASPRSSRGEACSASPRSGWRSIRSASSATTDPSLVPRQEDCSGSRPCRSW